MLLFAGFGWGRPVQINPNNFNRTITLRKGNALVALARTCDEFNISSNI